MNECQRIADQFRRAMEGDAWHGPALRELLQGVSPEMAAGRPMRGVRSIWEIVLHIAAWTEAVCRRLHGDPARLMPEEDWPAITAPTEQAWKAALDRLALAQQALVDELASLSTARLDEPIMPGMSSVYVTLHGVVQHHLYHAGQIALLKKAAG
jgi:uncharacterized damage-inducible protein DinB